MSKAKCSAEKRRANCNGNTLNILLGSLSTFEFIKPMPPFTYQKTNKQIKPMPKTKKRSQMTFQIFSTSIYLEIEESGAPTFPLILNKWLFKMNHRSC